ncbi:sensor histidine kinase [Kineococcus arenarius]|uniref:sensor histidine kinase n=1 Tax=Kineococcus sp. SYSU DK007 TaxID=3383128 RepID=UPI003D7E2743
MAPAEPLRARHRARAVRWWAAAGMRTRSTVAAVLVLALIGVVTGTGGLLVLRRSLLDTVATAALVQARLVRVAVTPGALEGTDPVARARLDALVGADEARGTHVQVVTDGAVVTASRALAGLPPLSLRVPAVAQAEVEVRTLPELGEEPRLVAVLGASADGLRYTVVVAESTAGVRATLRTAAVLLAAGGALLLVAAGAATRVFVGRSLRPVEAIRRTVDGITSDDLAGRVPVPAGDDEVSRLARTMNAMLARLQASQRAQRRFVADASHELRSPVATLRAAAEVQRLHPGATAPAEFAELVGGEAVRLERLVADLLLLARADEGAPAPARTEVDLDGLLESEGARLRASTALEVVVRTAPARVLGDAGQLTRVVRNLIDNAARHARGRVLLAVRTVGPDAVLSVTDDGPGVPEADRERVFDRFVRLQDSRERATGGTGLGLAIVAAAVAAHGGSVRCTGARPAPGAEFEVRLPLAAQEPDGAGDEPVGDEPVGGRQPPSAARR